MQNGRDIHHVQWTISAAEVIQEIQQCLFLPTCRGDLFLNNKINISLRPVFLLATLTPIDAFFCPIFRVVAKLGPVLRPTVVPIVPIVTVADRIPIITCA